MNRSSYVQRGHYLAILGLLGCATVGEERPHTIEPPPASGSTSGAAAGNDRDPDFVLSRQGSAPAKTGESELLHIGEKWWRFRADFLNVSEAEVKNRDAAISDRQAPTGFWDKQTATETVAIWGHLCNECHGGRRHLKDALGMPPPPEGWGRGEGLFFGNRRDYSAVFGTVNLGGAERNGKRSPMPPWIGKLAREQMWALLYFLEFQSGGIEGRFPPSLYPRPLGEGGK